MNEQKDNFVPFYPFLMLLSTAPVPAQIVVDQPAADELLAERAGIQAAWHECLYDRADALAGYARLTPERAAELALAGCEEKARVFRQLLTETTAAAEGARLLADVESAMKRYALVVARASAAVPLEPTFPPAR